MTDLHRPLRYQAAHLEEALATDPRVGEQALHVHIDGEALIVEGCAATEERRDAVALVSAEHLPEVEVRNHVTVVRIEPPAGTEP